MTQKPLVIVNPKAGSARAGKGLDELLRVVEGALGSVDVEKTERARHAVDIAEKGAREGREVVVAIGGDGSVHEVANGLLRAREAGFTQAALGIVGAGTGGDFCKTLGIEHKLERYLSTIAARNTRTVDVGRLTFDGKTGRETSYFVNILSAGLGGLVDTYVRNHARWAGGKLGYFLASTQALIESDLAAIRVKIEIDGESREEELRTLSIAICNGRYFGSGMHIAPMAKPDDGVFEVVSLGWRSKVKFAVSGSSVYSGAHIKDPDVTHFPCQKLSLEVLNDRAKGTFLLDVDGEPLGAPPLEVEVLKQALPVLVPP